MIMAFEIEKERAEAEQEFFQATRRLFDNPTVSKKALTRALRWAEMWHDFAMTGEMKFPSNTEKAA